MTWPQKQCSPYTQRAENQIFTNSKTAHSEFWFEVSHNPSLTEGRRPKNNTTTPHTHTVSFLGIHTIHECVALWVFYLQTCICVGGFEKYFVSAFSYTGRTFPWSDAKPPPQKFPLHVRKLGVGVWVSRAWKLTLCSMKMLYAYFPLAWLVRHYGGECGCSLMITTL